MFHSPTLSKLVMRSDANKSKIRIMNGPQDIRAWNHGKTTWLKFVSSSKNNRLDLFIDEVNPFGQE